MMIFCGYEFLTVFRQRNVDNMSEHIFAEIIIKRHRSFACPSWCQQRRVARHQAVATSHAYVRRGANRKQHTCAFTHIRPHLQNCGAAGAQRALALRRAVSAPVWCHRPLRLMRPRPCLGWLPEPLPDDAPAVCFFILSLALFQRHGA